MRGALGDRVEGKILVGTLRVILHGVREELQLVNQVREFGGVDLRELDLPDRQLTQYIFHDTRGDEGSPMIHIFGKL